MSTWYIWVRGPRQTVVGQKQRRINLKLNVGKISIQSLNVTESDLLMMSLKFKAYVIERIVEN